MMGKRTVTFLMIAVVAVVTICVLTMINRHYIFQEGNPIPVFCGIFGLEINKKPYVQISVEPEKYIARSGSHNELFAFIEKKYNVKLKADAGNVYSFQGDKTKIMMTQRLYSRSFQVWIVTVQ